MTTTIYIAKNVYGGDGLGRLGDGRVVFVPGAWAGENVKAEIVEEKRHFVKARLVEVVDPSPDRLQPTTNNQQPTTSLPGMVYSGLSYAGELAAKEQQLKDFFDRARIAIPEIQRIATAESPFNYRNKVVYHFAKQKGQWVLGYRTEPTHEIVDVTEDPLAVKPINQALPEIRRAVMALLTRGAEAVRRDVANQGNVTIRWSSRTGVKWWLGNKSADGIIKEDTCGRVFEVPSDGFYQVNPFAGEALVKSVVDAYRSGADTAENILDLYCGVGVFGLSCRPPKLTGIESGRQAVDFAKRNAASQGFPEAKFFAEEVGRNLRRIAVGSRTTVIVDPPRGGLEPKVPAWLAASKAPRIFYVSCDPATLMRDLKILTQAYDVAGVKWIDMFPRTARFETFVELKRR